MSGTAAQEARERAARERATWERWTREVLHALATHPKRLLLGWEPRAVEARPSGRGWGELVVTLARPRRGGRAEGGAAAPDGASEHTLKLYVVPRLAMEKAFRLTETLAISHDAATPADTLAKERVIDVFARALERYAAARRRAPEPHPG